LRERDPLSAILARLARRKNGEEEEEPAPATPLATWTATGPLGTPDNLITIDIDLAQ